jgi:hypothetical protein
MSEPKKRRSLELTPTQFAALSALAAEFNLSPGVGPTPKHPSWRKLIRQIADKKLSVTTHPETTAKGARK